jgi:hypothetical protein
MARNDALAQERADRNIFARAAELPSDLRAHLVPASQLRPRLEPARLSSGVPLLDEMLRGGWIRGGLNELCGPRSSGRTGLLYRSLATAQARHESVALIDLHGALDVHGAFHLGLDLERLLWVRSAAAHVLKAADLLVSAGGFGLLAVDLGSQPLRAPTAAWQRLQRAAEKHRTALLVSAPSSVAGFLATVSVALERPKPFFVQEGPPLFVGLDVQAAVTRFRRAAETGASRPANQNASTPRLSLAPFHVRRGY